MGNRVLSVLLYVLHEGVLFCLRYTDGNVVFSPLWVDLNNRFGSVPQPPQMGPRKATTSLYWVLLHFLEKRGTKKR